MYADFLQNSGIIIWVKVIIPRGLVLLGLFSTHLISAPLGQTLTANPNAPAKENPSMTSATDQQPTELPGVVIPKMGEKFSEILVGVKSVREQQLLPLNYGGTTFIGLVGRLLGEAINRTHEGIYTRRHVYFAEDEKKNVLGVAHGSRAELVPQNPFDVVVFYSPGGTVLKVEAYPLPEKVKSDFEKENILGQFKGHTTESFEVIRGRRGKLVSKGVFLTKARRPTNSEARAYFEKILRSVRFNAAFMDVAFFITQHPDKADIPVQEFPDHIGITKGMPEAGPEAFVRDKKMASPIDGKAEDTE